MCSAESISNLTVYRSLLAIDIADGHIWTIEPSGIFLRRPHKSYWNLVQNRDVLFNGVRERKSDIYRLWIILSQSLMLVYHENLSSDLEFGARNELSINFSRRYAMVEKLCTWTMSDAAKFVTIIYYLGYLFIMLQTRGG
jgi:hypothetical protein